MTPTKSTVTTRRAKALAATKVTKAVTITKSLSMNSSYITVVHDKDDDDVMNETTEIISTLRNKLASANGEIETLEAQIIFLNEQFRELQLELEKRDAVVLHLKSMIHNRYDGEVICGDWSAD